MALFLVVIDGDAATSVRARIAPVHARIGDSARRGWSQLARWRAGAASMWQLARPALDVNVALAQLESAVALTDDRTRLENVVAGVMAIGPART